jgi:hypothetical protein
MDGILWIIVVAAILLTAIHMRAERRITMEAFAGSLGSPMELSTQALDAAPTTSEVKQHYANLLLFAHSDIQQSGTKALRLLADFRDRVYGPRNFRADLTTDDFLESWPSWLPPLDPTLSKQPVPSVDDAVNAEVKMLAYLQKNFPQEDSVDEQTGSTIRNLIDDFGLRFVFEEPPVTLRSDFLQKPLLQNWQNPVASQ